MFKSAHKCLIVSLYICSVCTHYTVYMYAIREEKRDRIFHNYLVCTVSMKLRRHCCHQTV